MRRYAYSGIARVMTDDYKISKGKRAIGIDMLKDGINAGNAKLRNDPQVQAVTGRALLTKAKIAESIISAWQEMLGNRSMLDPREMKWSDVLKASELMAKHAGMFAEDNKGNTYNTVIVNAKEEDEAALLERLARIRAERSVESAMSSPPIIDASAA